MQTGAQTEAVPGQPVESQEMAVEHAVEQAAMVPGTQAPRSAATTGVRARLVTALRRSLALVAGTLLLGPGLAAESEEISAQHRAILEELRAMEERWEYVPFELDFKPLTVGRIIIEDHEDVGAVYHYLTFRIRNRQANRAEFIQERHSAYHEVLQSLAEEYRLEYVTDEQGTRLRDPNVRQISEDAATILERPADAVGGDRALNVTALVYDENGSRIDLLDEVPGSGERPQDQFAFPDRGDTRYSMSYGTVRKAIEEKEGRRLLSMHEIRDTVLDTYDPQVRDDEGVAQGELFGVLIFDRLSPEGDLFTVLIQGLSNKLRPQGIVLGAGDPEVEGKPQDYYNAKVLRRTYRVEVERPGDEYYLHTSPLTIAEAGWVWEPAFLRLEQRRTMAYAKYFLDHVPLSSPRPHPSGQGQLLHDSQVLDENLDFLDTTLEKVESDYRTELEKLQAKRSEIAEYYREWSESGEADADFISDFMERRLEQIDARIQELKQQIDTVGADLPDLRGQVAE